MWRLAMNNRRKLIIAFGAGALSAPLSALAQAQRKNLRIGDMGLSQLVEPPKPPINPTVVPWSSRATTRSSSSTRTCPR